MIASLRIPKTGVAVRLALGFLAVVVLAAILGPTLGLADPYRIDAANLLSSPGGTGWAPTNWAATCWRGRSTAPGCRCRWPRRR
ncbi:hypothetical protein ACOTDT_06685 [Achromobacter xylosoxidans]